MILFYSLVTTDSFAETKSLSIKYLQYTVLNVIYDREALGTDSTLFCYISQVSALALDIKQVILMPLLYFCGSC